MVTREEMHLGIAVRAECLLLTLNHDSSHLESVMCLCLLVFRLLFSAFIRIISNSFL